MTACAYLKPAVLGPGSQSGVSMCPQLFLPMLGLSLVKDTRPASSSPCPVAVCQCPQLRGTCPTCLGRWVHNPDAGRWHSPLVAVEEVTPDALVPWRRLVTASSCPLKQVGVPQ